MFIEIADERESSLLLETRKCRPYFQEYLWSLARREMAGKESYFVNGRRLEDRDKKIYCIFRNICGTEHEG